jgi:hypothetical protein
MFTPWWVRSEGDGQHGFSGKEASMASIRCVLLLGEEADPDMAKMVSFSTGLGIP